MSRRRYRSASRRTRSCGYWSWSRGTRWCCLFAEHHGQGRSHDSKTPAKSGRAERFCLPKTNPATSDGAQHSARVQVVRGIESTYLCSARLPRSPPWHYLHRSREQKVPPACPYLWAAYPPECVRLAARPVSTALTHQNWRQLLHALDCPTQSTASPNDTVTVVRPDASEAVRVRL